MTSDTVDIVVDEGLNKQVKDNISKWFPFGLTHETRYHFMFTPIYLINVFVERSSS